MKRASWFQQVKRRWALRTPPFWRKMKRFGLAVVGLSGLALELIREIESDGTDVPNLIRYFFIFAGGGGLATVFNSKLTTRDPAVHEMDPDHPEPPQQ